MSLASTGSPARQPLKLLRRHSSSAARYRQTTQSDNLHSSPALPLRQADGIQHHSLGRLKRDDDDDDRSPTTQLDRAGLGWAGLGCIARTMCCAVFRRAKHPASPPAVVGCLAVRRRLTDDSPLFTPTLSTRQRDSTKTISSNKANQIRSNQISAAPRQSLQRERRPPKLER